MSVFDAALILLAGVAAGGINAAVGSGSLITFPTLLALGFPPVLANVSNNIGLVPGGMASVWGYRRELAGQRRRLLVLGSMSVLGGTAGALLLLVLPAAAFRAVVPVLIGLAVVLVAVQPLLARRLAGRAARRPARAGRAEVGPGALVATAACGIYGGYFGGAQGILLVGALGALLTETLQRLNALKNGLVTCVNAVAAITFLVVAPSQVDWRIVSLIAAGSTVGGLLGSRIGRRLPPAALRAVIVVVGVVAIVNLLT